MPSRADILKEKRAEIMNGGVMRALLKRLKKPDQLQRMHTTNRILAPGTLKCKKVRQVFRGWIRHLQGRVCTQRFADDCCQRVRHHFGLPMLEPAFHKEEVRRFHVLLKRARTGYQVAAKAMASVDNVETQLVEDLGYFIIFSYLRYTTYIFETKTVSPSCIHYISFALQEWPAAEADIDYEDHEEAEEARIGII